MRDVYSILQRPVVTEKSVKNQEQNVYTFVVAPSATKIDVKAAFTFLYGVKVTDVRMLPVRSKIRKMGATKFMTKRKASKRAVIQAEKKVDIMKIVAAKTAKKTVKK
ncbi:50S ribosomal protein L23 [Candidatus Peregrinibacteria bacterium]|nr:MAG: 50S ribosomal protein L23 [Candidatus Peregrinibacteria bacterium]